MNKKKRIGIFTIGSRGDVQPITALAKALVAAGFDVIFVTSEDFKPFLEKHGLKHAPIQLDIRQLTTTRQAQAMMTSSSNLLKNTFWMLSFIKKHQPKAFQEALAALAGCDLLIYAGFTKYLGFHLGEALGIPALPAHLQPHNSTIQFPQFLFPPRPFSRLSGKGYHAFTYTLFDSGGWLLLKQSLNSLRKQAGLPALRKNPFTLMEEQKIPVLYGISPHVLAKPRDWGSHLHLTGYWFLEPDLKWRPPAALEQFLAAGPPPLYVGFGSMSQPEAKRNTEIIVRVLTDLQERAVLLTGWGGLLKGSLPATMHIVEDVPHQWLFPRMKAIIHHGGAGTTSESLRAGKPTLILPFFVDQPFWGNLVHNLGLGPGPISQKRLSYKRFYAAVKELLETARYAANAAALGEKIRSERGLDRAVAVIQQTLAKHSH